MPEKFVRRLPVRLADAEVDERAARLARGIRQRDVLEEERKASAREFRDQMENLRVEILELSRQVESHEEMRPVECHEQANRERRTMDLYRDDTGEVVESRGLHPGELQGVLELPAAKVRRKAAGDDA